MLVSTEDIRLKTNKGGLKECKLKPKKVIIYPTQNPKRCPVAFFYKCCAKVPHNTKTEALYLHLIKNYTAMSWYYDNPVGVNMLQDVVKKLYQKAGLEGHYTNHSLRSTCATRMYQAGVNEQFSAEVTEHRSLAIHSYKCSNDQQRRATTTTLSQPCDTQDSASADFHG